MSPVAPSQPRALSLVPAALRREPQVVASGPQVPTDAPPSAGEGAAPVRDWAVLVYSSASPDIEAAARQAIHELETAHLSSGVAVGVQLGTHQGVERYVIEPGGKRPADAGEQPEATDMSQGASLEAFVRWGTKAIPARHTLLVVGGHGGGFLGVVEDAERRHLMPLAEMQQAIERSGAHPDVLALNACLMAGVEVGDQLRGTADWLVASQAVEEGAGMPLGEAVQQLSALTTPTQAAAALVRAAQRTPERTSTLSAVSEAALVQVEQQLDALGRAVLADPGSRARLLEHIAATRSFYEERPFDRPLCDYRDAVSFAERLADDEGLPSAIREAARGLGEATRHSVVAVTNADGHGAGSGWRADAHGLSLYLPLQSLDEGLGAAGRAVHAQYRELHLSRSTSWDEAVELLTGGA